jgi:hypothetical protein
MGIFPTGVTHVNEKRYKQILKIAFTFSLMKAQKTTIEM